MRGFHEGGNEWKSAMKEEKCGRAPRCLFSYVNEYMRFCEQVKVFRSDNNKVDDKV